MRRPIQVLVALGLSMLTGGAFSSAALAATTVTVPPHAFVMVYVREFDVRNVPAPGVVVTMSVAAGGGTAVASAVKSGPTGPPAKSANSATDRLGDAWFQLSCGGIGQDTFTWNDGHGHSGQVVVAVSASATPAPSASAIGANGSGAAATAAAVAGGSGSAPSGGASDGSGGAVSTGNGGAIVGNTAGSAGPTALQTAVTILLGLVLAAGLLFGGPRLLRWTRTLRGGVAGGQQ